MLAMDDGHSDVVDWEDGDDPQNDVAQSAAPGAEADAVSLGSDDEDDLEALKKYHHSVWDGSRGPPASEAASQEPADAPPASANASPYRDAYSSRATTQTDADASSRFNVHGLPAKPPVEVYSGPARSSAVTTAATSMANRQNGNSRNSDDPQRSNGVQLPPGWEHRVSSKGEPYYYDTKALRTYWDLPTQYTARPANPRDRSEAQDRGAGSGSGDRRSRSRERGSSRRSPPAREVARARSHEREATYRSNRHASPPRREAGPPSRDYPQPRARSRDAPRERKASPRPSRPSERRSRSPGRTRQRDEYRPEKRSEPSQPIPSRRRSPLPRPRSQERAGYRTMQDTNKQEMDVDKHEPSTQGNLRRRRSWGSPDPSDSKRRRVAGSPPRGIDRYVPESSSNRRMDVDDPPSHRDPNRPNGPETSGRSRPSRPVNEPPPRDRRERSPIPAASDRQARPAGDYDQRLPPSRRRTPPTDSRSATDSSMATHRARAPLPSQSDAMRFGNLGPPPRNARMDVDANGSANPYRPERASAASKSEIPRGEPHQIERGRSRSPSRKRGDDRSSRYHDNPASAPMNISQSSRQDRLLNEERAPYDSSRDRFSSRLPNSMPEISNGYGRGRGPRQGPSPVSVINSIPLANPKEFGKTPPKTEESARVERQAEPSRPAQESPMDHKNDEYNPQNEAAPKRKASRFGPPPMAATTHQSNPPLIPPESSGTREAQPEIRMEERQEVEHPLPPTSTTEGSQGQLQRPRFRIDRNRTSIQDNDGMEEVERRAESMKLKGLDLPSAPATAGGSKSAGDSVDSPVTSVLKRLEHSMMAPPVSPQLEAAKPSISRQGSLLERLAPAGSDSQSGIESGDVDHGAGSGERGRKPRGRRGGRGGRR